MLSALLFLFFNLLFNPLFSPPDWRGKLGGWIAIYTAIFGPLAFIAAQTGNFSHFHLWIFLPVWPLLYLITHPRYFTKLIPIFLICIILSIFIILISISWQ